MNQLPRIDRIQQIDVTGPRMESWSSPGSKTRQTLKSLKDQLKITWGPCVPFTTSQPKSFIQNDPVVSHDILDTNMSFTKVLASKGSFLPATAQRPVGSWCLSRSFSVLPGFARAFGGTSADLSSGRIASILQRHLKPQSMRWHHDTTQILEVANFIMLGAPAQMSRSSWLEVL